MIYFEDSFSSSSSEDDCIYDEDINNECIDNYECINNYEHEFDSNSIDDYNFPQEDYIEIVTECRCNNHYPWCNLYNLNKYMYSEKCKCSYIHIHYGHYINLEFPEKCDWCKSE
jgi:hypothetical protein